MITIRLEKYSVPSVASRLKFNVWPVVVVVLDLDFDDAVGLFRHCLAPACPVVAPSKNT